MMNTTDSEPKLPKMEWATFAKLLEQGVREFHNGKTRRRFFVGADFMFIMYKTKPTSRSTSGVLRHDFVKWCKGYVKDGVMYDVTGKALEDGLPVQE